MFFRASQGTALDFGIQVVAVLIADIQQPSLMIDARNQRADGRSYSMPRPASSRLAHTCTLWHRPTVLMGV